MQDFHRRSNLPVHEALAEVVPKVEFGSQVMLALIWLQQFHRCSGLPVQTEQKACLQKVYMDQDALQRELAESKKKRERANDLALAYAAASTANPHQVCEACLAVLWSMRLALQRGKDRVQA